MVRPGVPPASTVWSAEQVHGLSAGQGPHRPADGRRDPPSALDDVRLRRAGNWDVRIGRAEPDAGADGEECEGGKW